VTISSRRAFLAAASALPALGVPSALVALSGSGAAGAVPKSRFQMLVAEWMREKYSIDHPDADWSDEENEAWGDRMQAIEKRVIYAQATTLDDLRCLFEAVREDFYEFHCTPGLSPDLGEQLVLASFDKALKVLGRLVEA